MPYNGLLTSGTKVFSCFVCFFYKGGSRLAPPTTRSSFRCPEIFPMSLCYVSVFYSFFTREATSRPVTLDDATPIFWTQEDLTDYPPFTINRYSLRNQDLTPNLPATTPNDRRTVTGKYLMGRNETGREVAKRFLW